jgi:glycosyltransferase involved in cell wall biosynthesis
MTHVTEQVRILGTRGIPGRHGGFETFAEDLALHLVARGWEVTVYCQESGRGPLWEDHWQGVRRIRIPVALAGAPGTILFDWRAARHAARSRSLTLILGYNTAVFGALLRARGMPFLLNLDGIEWRRAKYGPLARAWLWLNEILGCWLATRVIADHPEIAVHAARRIAPERISMIPYGARRVENTDPRPLRALGLEPDRYALIVCRPVPENSLAELVTAFSARQRGLKLVVLGDYRAAGAYGRHVQRLAGDEVVFPGALYEARVLNALRGHARLYLHGHVAGGTNPALVEALGAGLPVLAHDNRFNRWVAGAAARYFASEGECAAELDSLLDDSEALAALASEALIRYEKSFVLSERLTEYEALLARASRAGLR